MQLELTVDGTTYTLEVDPVGKTVRYRGQSYPYRVVAPDTAPVELEIAGERMLVDGWPPHNPEPVGRLTVNGEMVRLEKILRAAGAASAQPAAPVQAATPAPAAAPGGSASGPGQAVRPPMPGKILEVRVKEGDPVRAGQLLVVLEAMKMRNEVVSPMAGTVVGLAVAPGTSVKASDVLLRITVG